MRSDKLMTVGLIIISIGLALLLIGVVFSIPSRQKPEILILSETFVTNWEGQTILLVDYTVGGIATNATFREHQMDKYNALMDHLEKTGRVSR